MILLLTMVLIGTAAFFKAVADTLLHHFSTSIFQLWDEKFWNAAVSHKYAITLPFTKYKLDGWHLSNTAMIASFCLAVVLHTKSVIPWYLECAMAGVIYILVFNVFYNRILRHNKTLKP